MTRAISTDEETVRATACVDNSAFSAPPARFTRAAKEAWVSVPETVRAEVLRLERELMAGLKKHQAAAARDAALADFHDRAAKGGTTLRDALSRYVELEDLLRTDPDRGVEAIFGNIGVNRRSNLTPYRRPILTPLSGGFWR